jgi:two-component system, cell cycle response regulator
MPDSLDPNLCRLVVEALPIGVYVVNREGKILLWSAGAERVTGYLRQEVIGRSCGNEFLGHTDSANNPLQGNAIPLVELLRDGNAVDLQVSLKKKGGHFVLVRDEGGKIQGAVEIFEELSSTAKNDRRGNKLAAHGCIDPVTGVLSRAMVQAHLQEHLNLYATHPVPFSVMCFAIDELSTIRERYGQAAVDEALRVVAQTLASGLRPTDFVGRWQEFSFLAILSECREIETVKAGERLSKMVQQIGFSWWGDTLRITVSVGASPAREHDSPEIITGRAEEALQEGIKTGGNHVVVVAT